MLLATHWLRMEARAVAALAAPANAAEAAEFYESKRHASAFVFDRLLTRTSSHRAAILAPTASVMAMPVDDFAFD